MSIEKKTSRLFHFQSIGGGWIEAQNSRGEVGLVPEDYIEVRRTHCEHSGRQPLKSSMHRMGRLLYKCVCVLRECAAQKQTISREVRAGRPLCVFCCVFGPSGSGKMIAKLFRPGPNELALCLGEYLQIRPQLTSACISSLAEA